MKVGLECHESVFLRTKSLAVGVGRGRLHTRLGKGFVNLPNIMAVLYPDTLVNYDE